MNRTPRRRGSPLPGIALILVLGLHAACSSVPRPVVPPEGPAAQGLPRKVAVLPFVNRSSNPEAAGILRRMFYNFFSSLSYVDVEPAVVDASLSASGLLEGAALGPDVPVARLGQLLGVDAVVVGEALALGQTYALLYANQQAGLRARLIRCTTGQVLWELEHTVTLHDGDLPTSLPGLAASILKTALTFQQANLMRAAAELCMQMTATIPAPPAVAEPPPRIQTLVHNAAGRLLAPGDWLRVAMIGEPGQKASLGLAPLIDELPMEEREPGVYVAAYCIQPQDRLTGGRLAGYLRSASGASRQWVDTLGVIRIGSPTILPAAIAADTVLAAAQSPYLVEEALVVMPGATLTLEPGVVVWVGGLGLVVRGTIQVRGTAEQPVRINGLGASSWKGILVDGSRGENTFRHCRVSGAEFGIRAARSRLAVEGCRLEQNTWGLVADEGHIDVRGSLVRASAKSGIAVRHSELTVTDSVITENAAGGLLLEGSPARIEGNHIANNGGWGIKTLGAPAAVLAGRNWWGRENPEPAEVIRGSASIHPPLAAPIGLSFPAAFPD